MIDLSEFVAGIFSDVRHEFIEAPLKDSAFRDPHPDADTWLAANPRERRKMAPIYAAKLAEFIKRHTRNNGTALTRRREASRAWKATNGERVRVYQESYRKSERSLAYEAARAETKRAYMAEYRKRKKPAPRTLTPEQYAAKLAYNREYRKCRNRST